VRKSRRILYYLLPCILLLFSLATVFSNSIWYDEAATLELAGFPVNELVRIDAMDVHPPLYYLILKLGITLFGGLINEVYLGKIISIIPFIVLLIIGFTKVKKIYGEKVSFFFNIMVIGMPQMLNYSTEIRMYSWGMLFVTCAFLQLPGIRKDENNTLNYVLLTLFSTLASYTHYFACVSAIVIYAELIILFVIAKNYKTLRKVFLSGFAVALLFSPWLMVFIRQAISVKENFWMASLTFDDYLDICLFLFFKDSFLKYLFILIVLISVIGIIKCKNETGIIAACGVFVWLGTIATGLIISILVRPVFVARYEICSASCLWLGLALGLGNLDEKYIKNKVLVFLVTGACLVTGVSYLTYEFNMKENTATSLSFLSENLTEDALILNDYDHFQGIIPYYYPEVQNVFLGYELNDFYQNVYSNCNCESILSIEELDNYDNNTIIVIDSIENGWSLRDVLEEQGYKPEFLGFYYLDRYGFNAYIIS